MPCATKNINDGTKSVICYKDKDDTKKKKATAKKAKAATIVRNKLSTRATMSVGLVTVSPNKTTVPAVTINAMKTH